MNATTKTPKLPNLTPLESLEQAAECLKTLAHPHRLRIIQMLLQGQYTVGELAEACGIPSHMASEHLRLMQRCDDQRKGRQESLLPDRRTALGEHHGLRGGSFRWQGQVIFFRHLYRLIGIFMNIQSNQERPDLKGRTNMELLIPLGVLAVWIILQAWVLPVSA